VLPVFPLVGSLPLAVPDDPRDGAFSLFAIGSAPLLPAFGTLFTAAPLGQPLAGPAARALPMSAALVGPFAQFPLPLGLMLFPPPFGEPPAAVLLLPLVAGSGPLRRSLDPPVGAALLAGSSTAGSSAP
jgi:hypothetical protein